jgi:hypothetical protein
MHRFFFTNLKYQSDNMVIKSFINKYVGGIFWFGYAIKILRIVLNSKII